MSQSKGILIAVEGVDGAGKHTQVVALRRELEQLGFMTSEYSFPDYEGSRLGGTVKQMLSGKFGDATKIHPMLSAPLFALERSEKRDSIKRDLRDGLIVICDRYVYSNVAHQACRLPDDQRSQFEEWLERIEFDLLGLPRPQLTILLDVEDEAASRRRHLRALDPEQNRCLDDYERDETALSLARSIYLELAKRHQWTVVPTTVNGTTLDRNTITKNLLEYVKPLVGVRNDA